MIRGKFIPDGYKVTIKTMAATADGAGLQPAEKTYTGKFSELPSNNELDAMTKQSLMFNALTSYEFDGFMDNSFKMLMGGRVVMEQKFTIEGEKVVFYDSEGKFLPDNPDGMFYWKGGKLTVHKKNKAGTEDVFTLVEKL